MTEELKRCSYCGKPGEYVGMDFARCSDIECFLHYVKFPIREWQTHPLESALQSKLDKAVAALKAIRAACSSHQAYDKDCEGIARNVLAELEEK